MNSEGQAEVLEFLASPATHGGAPVEQIETHSSVVFLACVEWVIEMTRFDQAALFDRLAARGELDLALMRPRLHDDRRCRVPAAARPRRDRGGGPSDVRSLRGLWLDAAEEVPVDRVGRRRGDASDADAAVVDLQTMQDMGPSSWRPIDAAADLDAVVRQAASALPPR